MGEATASFMSFCIVMQMDVSGDEYKAEWLFRQQSSCSPEPERLPLDRTFPSREQRAKSLQQCHQL